MHDVFTKEQMLCINRIFLASFVNKNIDVNCVKTWIVYRFNYKKQLSEKAVTFTSVTFDLECDLGRTSRPRKLMSL